MTMSISARAGRHRGVDLLELQRQRDSARRGSRSRPRRRECPSPASASTATRHEVVVDADRAGLQMQRRRRRAPPAGRRAPAGAPWRRAAARVPGVSSPASVVRSMQVMARSSQAACHSFFTVRRVGRVAARRSTALRFTRTASTQSRSSGMPGLRAIAACSVALARALPRVTGGVSASSAIDTLSAVVIIATPIAPHRAYDLSGNRTLRRAIRGAACSLSRYTTPPTVARWLAVETAPGWPLAAKPACAGSGEHGMRHAPARMRTRIMTAEAVAKPPP